jgi:sRNA-binding protein
MNWAHVRIGEECKVFMGAGWEKGVVINKYKDAISVKLKNKIAMIYDDRNVKR